MFFAPPEVRAISKYSDFGSHLGLRTFGIMLIMAIIIHALVFGVIASRPHTKIIKIPVRVLNFNLGNDIKPEIAPQAEQPIQQPEQKSVSAEPEQNEDKAPQEQLDDAITSKKVKPVKESSIVVPVSQQKPKTSVKEVRPKQEVTKPAVPAETPKRYVRESPLDIAKPKQSTAAETAATKPEEIIQRYEQAISLWFSQHKVYPEEAKRKHIEGDAVVRVRINRQGHILYYVIDKSSGDAFIDHAVMNMVRASDPAPAVPENYPEGEEFEFLVPVSFRLQQ